MHDTLNVTVGNHVSGMTPETLISQTRAILVSVAFFNEGRKGGENFRKKNVYMESEKGREKPA